MYGPDGIEVIWQLCLHADWLLHSAFTRASSFEVKSSSDIVVLRLPRPASSRSYKASSVHLSVSRFWVSLTLSDIFSELSVKIYIWYGRYHPPPRADHISQDQAIRNNLIGINYQCSFMLGAHRSLSWQCTRKTKLIRSDITHETSSWISIFDWTNSSDISGTRIANLLESCDMHTYARLDDFAIWKYMVRWKITVKSS